jgi:asparagine synthase (glutamine-hydrolysing)
MMEPIAHRGPDDAGYHLRARVALGHRRLAIIDRKLGKQPLANEDDTVWIVYNGEVYNHEQLRRELIRCGHRFRTHSDTEAIVHAYEEWGPGCARRLRGMFAFAIWDERRRRLLLCRDRFGIKPLYYAELDGGDLVFASEVKALYPVLDLDRRIDRRALAAFLALRYVPAPLTLLAGVKKLPPAHTLTLESGRVTLERYWDLPDGEPLSRPTAAAAAFDLRQHLDTATELRLMSEVPVGAFLSGGIDSTAVTCAMVRGRDVRAVGPLHTFSVGYAEAHPDDDELAWARLAARHLGTEHHEVRVSVADVARELDRIVWHLDEPLGDAAAIPLYFLSRLAKEHVTVVLSGEGADELLGGYAIYARAMLGVRLRRAVGPLHATIDSLGRRLGEGRLRRLLRSLGPSEAYRGVARAFDADTARQLFPDGPEGTVVDELFSARRERARTLSPLRRLLYLDLGAWLPDDLLTKADRMTMAHAVELRVPFLDHRLAEHVWALPDHLLVDGRVGKALLRHAMRGRVPEAIVRRKKLGFATPTASWLRDGLKEQLEGALFASGSFVKDHFDAHVVRGLVERHRAGVDLEAELWPLFVLELWHQGLRRSVAPSGRAPEVVVPLSASVQSNCV